ncbi:MAG: hypothetical protein MJZ57_03250 [Bacteroidales bacterium]|nr:hypothetical protein [Bacteroidales bacterium]
MVFSVLEAKKHHIFFFYEYQSRAQKWCKREQSQAGLNYAECSPFSHGKNNQLSGTLATFFSKNINLAHIKLISLFMMALCKARTVCFCKLSTCFDSPAKADSCLRRIQRFFSEHSSNTQERINLVQRYINLFRRETIDCLLADREFVGERWIMKSAGFNIEDTHLTDIERIEKLLLLVMMAFVWCYNIGEFVNLNLKSIRILKHGRKAKSIFRYGLDIVTEFLTRGRNDYDVPIFGILSSENPTFTPA